MGKDEKKTHNKFHCDQMNGSWFKSGGTNFRHQVHGEEGGEFFEFLENFKSYHGEEQEEDA